jgi:hypothetical protein
MSELKLTKDNKYTLSNLHTDRIIFPLIVLKGTYNIKTFNPRRIDNKCTIEDIVPVIIEINRVTNFLAPIRKAQLYIIISALVFVVFSLYSFVEIWNAIDKSDTEAAIIASLTIVGASLQLVLVHFWGSRHWNKSLPALYSKLTTVLHHHRKLFSDKGLRWRVSETLSWIELTTDFRNNPVLFNYPNPNIFVPIVHNSAEEVNSPSLKEERKMPEIAVSRHTSTESDVWYSMPNRDTLKRKLLEDPDHLDFTSPPQIKSPQ